MIHRPKRESVPVNVKVIDAIMGAGKTSFAIQLMQEADSFTKFIYVTPFLTEVERIKTSVTNRDFKEPDTKHGSGTKLESLKRLIKADENIATTHELFSMADDELMELLEWGNYVLIVDEVMEVISQVQDLRKHDIPVLLNSGLIEISEDSSVIWKADPKTDTQYNKVRDYALAGNLYSGADNTAFLWNFPAKVFKLFKDVYIMTYMFDGQVQKYYYDLHGIQYTYCGVAKEGNRYRLIPKEETIEDRAYFKELIQIYEGNLNDLGNSKTALSLRWFENRHNADKLKQLQNNLYNYFQNITDAKADEIMWTTFKDFKEKLKGKGYSKEADKNGNTGCFTSWNLRATNQYKHKTTLAFCLNRYMNPIEKNFFSQNGITVDVELLALSDLLQWLFRSAVREGKPVQVYIPSKRMRNLLTKWLDGELSQNTYAA